MESLWRLLLAPVMVLLLAVFAIWLQRRRHGARIAGSPTSSDRPLVVDSVPLGQNSRLLVIDWRNSRLLVGQTAAGLSVLDRRPRDEAAGPAA
jgi:flagellar biogenesis protein FliO